MCAYSTAVFTQRPLWAACATPVAFLVRTFIAERIVDPGMRAEAAPGWTWSRIMKQAVFNGVALSAAEWNKGLAGQHVAGLDIREEFLMGGLSTFIAQSLVGVVVTQVVLRSVLSDTTLVYA